MQVCIRKTLKNCLYSIYILFYDMLYFTVPGLYIFPFIYTSFIKTARAAFQKIFCCFCRNGVDFKNENLSMDFQFIYFAPKYIFARNLFSRMDTRDGHGNADRYMILNPPFLGSGDSKTDIYNKEKKRNRCFCDN